MVKLLFDPYRIIFLMEFDFYFLSETMRVMSRGGKDFWTKFWVGKCDITKAPNYVQHLVQVHIQVYMSVFCNSLDEVSIN